MIALLLAIIATISGTASVGLAASHTGGIFNAGTPQAKVSPSPLTAHPLAG